MQYFFWRHRQIIKVLLVAVFIAIPTITLFAQSPGTFPDSYGPSNLPDSRASGGGSSVIIENPLAHGSTLCELLDGIFNVTLTLGIPIAVVFLVLAGLRFVTAMGNQKKLGPAKQNIYYTLLGIVLFIGAWFLAQVIAHTLVQLGGSDFNNCFTNG